MLNRVANTWRWINQRSLLWWTVTSFAVVNGLLVVATLVNALL